MPKKREPPQKVLIGQQFFERAFVRICDVEVDGVTIQEMQLIKASKKIPMIGEEKEETSIRGDGRPMKLVNCYVPSGVLKD